MTVLGALLGAFLVHAGLGALFVAAITPLCRRGDRRLLGRLTGASRSTCAALTTGGTLPRSVLMTGRTAPGSAGLLRSPAYGIPCVWYATRVTHDEGDSTTVHFRRSEGGPFGLTDGTGAVVILDSRFIAAACLAERRTESATVSRAQHPEPGTGMACLERAGLLGDRSYGRRWGRRLTLTEDVIPPGRELSVLARPRRAANGVVLDQPGETSRRRSDAWIEAVEDDVASAPRFVRDMLIVGVVLIAAGAALFWLHYALSL